LLNKSGHTHGLVINSSNFGVTILSDGQKKISDHFAGRTVGPEDRLSYLETESQVSKPSFIKGGLANLVCKVIQTVPTGMKTVFIAKVIVVQVKD
jgi:flavin reductase (DIM6/NTAB) family NADH-FMN oxidoreductase RutF